MSSAVANKSVAKKPKTNGRATSAKAKTNGHAESDYLDPKLLLNVLTAVKKGDFSSRMPTDQTGITGKFYDALNEIIEKNEMLTSELNRVSEVVGKEGKIAQRATLSQATGAWASCISSVNTLISDLTQPTTEVARVIAAVAEGDLLQEIKPAPGEVPINGE